MGVYIYRLEFYSRAHKTPFPSTFVFRALDLFLPRDSLLPRDEVLPRDGFFLDLTPKLSLAQCPAAGTSASNFPIPRCPGADGIEISERMLWGGPESMGGWSSASCEIGSRGLCGCGCGAKCVRGMRDKCEMLTWCGCGVLLSCGCGVLLSCGCSTRACCCDAVLVVGDGDGVS